jgi:hypothetical protein
MKNSIVIIAAGALVAGALAYLFLTENGQDIVESFKNNLKDKAKNLAAGAISDKTGIKKRWVKKATDQIV